MSLILHLDDPAVTLIDHNKYLIKINESINYVPKDIFNIQTPFRMDLEAERIAQSMLPTNNSDHKAIKRTRRKRKVQIDEHNENDLKEQLRTIELLSKALASIKEKHPNYFKKPPSIEVVRENNRSVRSLVKELSISSCDADYRIKGENSCLNDAKTIKIQGEEFIIPPGSKYVVNDIKDIKNQLQNEKKFDLILIDPPWENKHVKRTLKRHKLHRYSSDTTVGDKSDNTYEMLENDAIGSQLPIPELLKDNGIVVIYCTNSRKHQRALEQWLKDWKLKNITNWFWLKVTKSGEPVCKLDIDSSKKPYEMIYLAKRTPHLNENSTIIGPNGTNRVIISVPSAIHSHKPPLIEVFRELNMIDENSECLEIFGRYLTPGWTTFGNEALKLQNIRYFDHY